VTGLDRAFYEPSPWSERYHQTTADEVLGGGAAGPGKSLTLLFDPLVSQAVVEHARCTGQLLDQFPPWLAELCRAHPIRKGESEGHALHLRRTLTQVQETMDRAERMFPKFDPDAQYSKELHRWTFTSGYKYTFGHCRESNSHENYLSKQYCVASGTRVLMADDSLKAIEDIEAGELVMTLEGPRRVVACWDTGVKACVRATIEYRGAIVGTQVHPTTHPVLLWPTSRSPSASSSDRSHTESPSHHFGGEWQDFESLLDGLPKSPVTRVSRVARDSGFVTSDGTHLALAQLPAWFCRVALSERALRKQLPLAIGDGSDALTELETTKGCPDGCGFSCRLRGAQPRCPSECARLRAQLPGGVAGSSPCQLPDAPGGVPIRIPTNHVSSYAHFYTGASRPLTEAVRMGTARLEYEGWQQTFDLTVEGANHYITETGLISSNTHLGIDESYQFEQHQYDELEARVRSADPVLIHLQRTRLMSNPAPGWLKDYFVTPEPKGGTVLRRKVVDPITGDYRWKTRLFLPARLDDNPDKAFVKDYKFKLLSKPSHMRARYLYGDWESVEGGYFEDDWNPGVHVIEPFKIPREWPKFRSMDWGYKAPGTIGWFALDPDDNLYLFYEFNFRLMTDAEVAKRVIEIEEKFGFWNKRHRRSRLTGVADTQLWEERGDSGKSKAAVFGDHGIYWQPADKASIQRGAERITERLRDYDDKRCPGLMIFEGCKQSRAMFSSIQVDDRDNLLPDKRSPLAHWLDMIAYGCARASRGRKSITMELHDRDLPENDNDEEPLPKTGSFGYGN
jgi:hypothetical protein